MRKKNIVTLQDFSRDSLENLLNYALQIKKQQKTASLAGSSIITFLLSPDVHTRVAMEVVTQSLNLQNIVIDCSKNQADVFWDEESQNLQEEGEHVCDVARRMSYYGDCLAVRHIPCTKNWRRDRQDSLLKGLIAYGSLPVINLGSSLFNPCQALADILTIRSHCPNLEGWKVAICWTYSKNAYPMATPNSLALVASKFGMDVTIASPEGFQLDPALLKLIDKNSKRYGGDIELTGDLSRAVSGAHFVYAVPWRSINCYDDWESEYQQKQNLQSWKIVSNLMDETDGGYLMHPLPHKRNIAVEAQVLDSNTCLAYEQVENWNYTQQALIASILATGD